MKILFAVDGSDYTRRALDYLATHDWLRRDNAKIGRASCRERV